MSSKSRGHMQERSPGHWRLQVSTTDPDTGRRAQVSESIRGDKKAAGRKLTDMLSQIDRGTYVVGGAAKLADYLPKVYYKTARTRLRASTFNRYVQLLDRPPETIGAILDASKGGNLYLPFLLAATTGIRRGEVVALHWRDLDLKEGLAHINWGATYQGRTVSLAEPKSPHARRAVALPPATVTVLRRHRKEQTARRLKAGDAWQGFDLVVERGDGSPMHPDTLTEGFARIAEKVGHPEVRLHDLRHAYATTLLKAKVHPKVASAALGHSTVAFTLDTYSHVVDRDQDAARDAIQAALGGIIRK